MKLEDMMKNATKNGVDELDFFIEVIERGFTLKDFEKIGYYDYAKKFMEEHGLIEDDINDEIDLSSFVLVGNNRKEAYDSHIEYEKGFNDSDNPYLKMSYEEFCNELDKGYEGSDYLQIARLVEDDKGRVWYDNEYCG